MSPRAAQPPQSLCDTVGCTFHMGNLGFWVFFYIVSLPANFATLESRLHAILINFATIATAWALCYSLRAFYRRLPPLTSTSGIRYFGSVVLACIAAAIVWSGISFVTSMIILGPEIYGIPERLSTFNLGLPILAGMFLGWSGLYLGVLHWLTLKRTHDEKARAEEAAAAAELARLRHQTSPHFLFNTLNVIRADIDENPHQAGETLDALCEFLHYRMTQPPHEEITLREELNGVRAYLHVMEARFGSKIRWEINCEDICLDLPVPIYCVLPLVENAVKHGLPGNRLLHIMVAIASDTDSVNIAVCNTGRWKQPTGSGTGIANLERRLSHWTGMEQRVSLTKTDGWVTTGFHLPAHCTKPSKPRPLWNPVSDIVPSATQSASSVVPTKQPR